MDSNNEITHRQFFGLNRISKVIITEYSDGRTFIQAFQAPYNFITTPFHEESGPLPCETKLKFIIEKHKQFKNETKN